MKTQVDDINPQYAALTEASIEILGGNMHVGYWENAEDTSSMAEATNRMTDMMLDRVDPKPGQRLLDVGCGNAAPAIRAVRTKGVSVTGIDIGAYQLKLAEAQVRAEGLADAITVQYTDVNAMPFEAESFDHAWSSECLIHVADWSKTLSRIAHVLKPGGRIVVADCVERAPVDGPTREFLDAYYASVRCRYNKLDEIPAMVEKAGLELVELVEIGDHILERTMQAVDDGFRAKAARIEADYGMPAETTEKIGVDAVRFSKIPESGYAIVVARKPA